MLFNLFDRLRGIVLVLSRLGLCDLFLAVRNTLGNQTIIANCSDSFGRISSTRY
jgi:hypothetical protein